MSTMFKLSCLCHWKKPLLKTQWTRLLIVSLEETIVENSMDKVVDGQGLLLDQNSIVEKSINSLI